MPNGATDPGFAADVVPGRFKSVTALAVGATGSIFVAGTDRSGFSGALVVRLLADGTLDTLFGRAGATSVDLKSRRASFPTINDMKVVDGGGLVVGGSCYTYWSSGAFVARLLGKRGRRPRRAQHEAATSCSEPNRAGRVVLSVRRTGGSAGAVAVTYSTRDFPRTARGRRELRARRARDQRRRLHAATGRLTWADGDVGRTRDRGADRVRYESRRRPEFFEVVLESPEGGAGLGAFGADVEIAGASYPVGELTIQAGTPSVSEGDQAAFYVSRNYYGQGAVSVTVRVAAGGSATPGQDFRIRAAATGRTSC